MKHQLSATLLGLLGCLAGCGDSSNCSQSDRVAARLSVQGLDLGGPNSPGLLANISAQIGYEKEDLKDVDVGSGWTMEMEACPGDLAFLDAEVQGYGTAVEPHVNVAFSSDGQLIDRVTQPNASGSRFIVNGLVEDF